MRTAPSRPWEDSRKNTAATADSETGDGGRKMPHDDSTFLSFAAKFPHYFGPEHGRPWHTAHVFGNIFSAHPMRSFVPSKKRKKKENFCFSFVMMAASHEKM